MKHFLIFAVKPVCYNSYLYFADSLARELAHAGYRVEVFSSEKEPLSSMERFAGKSFDAVIDFNSGLPRIKMEEGGYFLDRIHAPFYNILLDHPLYHHDTLKQKIADFHVLCLDENHKNYIRDCYPHILSADLFPVTGEDIAKTDGSYPKKDLDVLFSGTYTDYREIEDSMKTCPSFLADLTKKLIDLMLQQPALTQEDALRLLLPSLEEAEIIEETFPLHMQACFLCDSYLRAFKREQLLLLLARQNVPLTLCGNGFRKSPLSDFPRIQIIDDIPYSDTFSLFRRAKITLNLLPEFKNGTHDRIYSALLNHSLCMTDSSPLLKRQFTDGKDLIFYEYSDIEKLPDRIFDLLRNPNRLEQISQNGYVQAKENHSWQARAAHLLSVLS